MPFRPEFADDNADYALEVSSAFIVFDFVFNLQTVNFPRFSVIYVISKLLSLELELVNGLCMTKS